MGNIVGRLFGVVASKNVADSLAESVKEGNQAKFYLAQAGPDANGIALDNVTKVTDVDRNVLIINGNIIQGINKKDIDKLDAISDATKIFKYKGSVNTKEQLLEKTPSSEVGDVYNVEVSIELNNIYYPAHTNFVYTGSSSTGDNEKYWDSLGGTMQIGTSAKISRVSRGKVYLKAENKMPISDFNLEVNTSHGLFIGTSDSSNNVALDLEIGAAIETGNNFDASNSIYNLVLYNPNNYPLGSVNISVANGLKVSTNIANNTSCIGLKLCPDTEGYGGLSSYEGAGISGLAIYNGGLYVALATAIGENKKFLTHDTGGIAVDYNELVKSLMADSNLKIYISSLIKNALTAQ